MVADIGCFIFYWQNNIAGKMTYLSSGISFNPTLSMFASDALFSRSTKLPPQCDLGFFRNVLGVHQVAVGGPHQQQLTRLHVLSHNQLSRNNLERSIMLSH